MRMLALLLLFAATAMAQQGMQYKVHRATGPIAVDGEREPAWAAAEMPANDPAAPQVLWDDVNLYLFFTCRDATTCGARAADNAHAENGCLAQIRIDPDPAHTDVSMGFRVSPAAQVETFVSFGTNYRFRNLRNQGARASVFQERVGDREGWNLEMAIPWSNFQDLNRKHEVGQIWRAMPGCTAETASSTEWVFVP